MILVELHLWMWMKSEKIGVSRFFEPPRHAGHAWTKRSSHIVEGGKRRERDHMTRKFFYCPRYMLCAYVNMHA